MAENNKAKLYTKILTVVSKMEAIEKSGYNSHQKYHYSTEEDLVNGIRDLLISNKLVILTSSETKEVLKLNKPNGTAGQTKETLVAVVNTTHKIIDAETGEFETVQSTGTGWDDTDKMTFKAVTGALKYFISKNFLVPSKDDAENDGVTVPKATEPKKTFSRPTVNAPAAAKPEVKAAPVAPPAPKEDKVEVAITPVAPPAPPAAKAAPRFASRTIVKTAEPKF